MCNQNKNKCVTKKGEQMTPPKGRPPSRSPKNVDTRSKLYILFSLVLILLFLKYIIIISNV